MPMSREEQDAFDRKMAGINAPGAYGEGMAALDRAVGNPIASYSLDDLRRMFLRGSAPAAASNSDALPGPALPGPVERMTEFEISPPNRAPSAAPMAPPPVPPPAPPVAMPTGTRPTPPVMPPPPAPAARIGAGMPAEAQADQRMFTVPTSEQVSRAKAQQLAAVLARTVPTGAEAASPGFEMQIMPDRLRGMPIEAQADQAMRSVSMVNPNSFGQRFRRTMRGE